MRRGTEWLGLKPVLHKNIGLLIGRLRKKIGPETARAFKQYGELDIGLLKETKKLI